MELNTFELPESPVTLRENNVYEGYMADNETFNDLFDSRKEGKTISAMEELLRIRSSRKTQKSSETSAPTCVLPHHQRLTLDFPPAPMGSVTVCQQ